MLKLSVGLYALNALASLGFGLRYVRRRELLPYQAKALGHGVAAFSPELRTVVLAMLKVIGGGFLANGFASLGLCVALWRGLAAANWALAIATAALLAPAWLAASRVDRLGPEIGAPTRPVLAAGAVAVLAFAAGLVG